MSSTSQTVLPTPWVVPPTNKFEGPDGNWTTFELEVGTPPQSFHVLPATVGQQVWVPGSTYCGPSALIKNCSASRGVENATSTGFAYSQSTSWTNLGIWGMGTETNLFSGNNAAYGLDTILLAQDTGSGLGPALPNQLVAAYAAPMFPFGQFGLGYVSSGISGKTYTSPLGAMKNTSRIPSLSFGYTAGKPYMDVQGSLILGGYDAARIPGVTQSFPIAASPQTSLMVNITSIQADQTLNGNNQNLAPTPMMMNIDSSTSQIWLPSSVVQTFVTAFGLIPDNGTSLFFVNSTTHAQLRQANPTIFFSIGSDLTIKIPYSAFDLTYNYYDYTGNLSAYFPIRQAANDSQLTLGRAFLQEAYVIVDWERMNLTIGQAANSAGSTSITPILPLSAGSTGSPGTSGGSNNGPSPPKGSSAGAIAGGVVGGIAALAAIILAFWYFRRRQRRQRADHTQPPKDAEQASTEAALPPPATEYYRDEVAKHPPQSPEPEEPAAGWYPPEKTQHEEQKTDAYNVSAYELSSPGVGPAELASSPRYELAGGAFPNRGASTRGGSSRELMSTPIHEMAGSDVGSELGVGSRNSVRRVQSPQFSATRTFMTPSPDFFDAPSPEHFASPMGSSSSVQVASSSAVHHFSSAQQEVVPSSEIVSNSAERDRLGGTASEIVVSSTPQQVASPLPVSTNTSPLASQPTDELIQSHERVNAERSE